MKFSVLLLSLCLACLHAQAAEPTKIRLCLPNSDLLAAHAFIADHLGYFKENGLDTDIKMASFGKICQDDLLAGKSDFAYFADAPFAYTSFSDHPLRIIAQTQCNPLLSVYARADAGIHSAADLKGKKVGYLPGTISYFYLAHLLDKVHLSLSDLKVSTVQPPAMPQALASGAIDAFVFIEPWGDIASKRLNGQVVRLHETDLYNPAAILVTRDDYASRNPEAVKRVLKSILQAETYLRQHPDDAMGILLGITHEDSAVMQRGWREADMSVRLDHSLIDLLQDDARYIQRDDANNKGRSMPDFRKYIDASFLADVASDHVEKSF